MIKPKLLVTALVVILLFAKANAQDTTHYDLGRIQLKKEFTQSVTVKGADLEKMPFDDISEAIRMWFNGAYSTNATLVYVIDGNLVNDVNAYSIYDIDEVTLIQNAVVNITGAPGPQQLVLIKTKRAKAKGFGVTANAQANISNGYTNNIFNIQNDTYHTGLISTNTLYQQYYVSVYKNTDNLKFGISADYLRDVMPVITGEGVVYPTSRNFDRLKLNTYFDVKLGNSTLNLTASYNPQKGGEVYDDYTNSEEIVLNDAYRDHMTDATLSLTTPIAHGFINVIHADYNYLGGTDGGAQFQSYNNSVFSTTYKYNTHNYNFVAYDNLSYNVKFGNWGLEPAVNLNFRKFKDSTYDSSLAYDQNGNVSSSLYDVSSKEHLFLLTPSVNLYYKSCFNIQGGFLEDLATIGAYNPVNTKTQKVLPFITASADVMQLINPNSSLTVKIYGSYAINDLFTDNFNLLLPFSLPSIQVPLVGSINNSFTEPYYGVDVYKNFPTYLYEGTAKTFKTVSAGLNISPKKSDFTFSYYFQKNNYLSPIYIYEPYGANSVEIGSDYTNANMVLNRLSLSYKLTESDVSWRTNINATIVKQTYPEENYNNAKISLGGGVWTGGWVNRLTYRDFFAGIDVLYEVGRKIYSESATGTLITNNANSFSLQNLYLGYHLKVKKLKNAEVFANARNIFQNQKEDITDDRKYYGIGLKVSL